MRTQVGKPGAYSFEPVDAELAERTRERLRAVYDTAYSAYEELVEAGVARELARSVLPVGAYTQFYWTVNARSLMNFVSLRNSEFAQLEIRRYAEAVESVLLAQDAGDARVVRGERPRRSLGDQPKKLLRTRSGARNTWLCETFKLIERCCEQLYGENRGPSNAE